MLHVIIAWGPRLESASISDDDPAGVQSVRRTVEYDPLRLLVEKDQHRRFCRGRVGPPGTCRVQCESRCPSDRPCPNPLSIPDVPVQNGGARSRLDINAWHSTASTIFHCQRGRGGRKNTATLISFSTPRHRARAFRTRWHHGQMFATNRTYRSTGKSALPSQLRWAATSRTNSPLAKNLGTCRCITTKGLNRFHHFQTVRMAGT